MRWTIQDLKDGRCVFKIRIRTGKERKQRWSYLINMMMMLFDASVKTCGKKTFIPIGENEDGRES